MNGDTAQKKSTISCQFLLPFSKGEHSRKEVDSSVSETLLKCVYSYRKEFALQGNKFFPLAVAPFEKGGKYLLVRMISLSGVSIHIKYQWTSLKTVFLKS